MQSSKMTPCDVKALKKCLEEHKGDGDKCRQHIAAFKTACSSSPSSSSPSSSTSVSSSSLSSSSAISVSSLSPTPKEPTVSS
ncbi:unnamed protein product [Sphagnum troendelagicum]|uniref:CHCH domain-containing protein n=1 Tax=Sphagnum troendelagicum TaxID=128251 RepID=A0ABP0U5Q8_9BRYO